MYEPNAWNPPASAFIGSTHICARGQGRSTSCRVGVAPAERSIRLGMLCWGGGTGGTPGPL
jgi:hypothetical protein